MELRQIAAEHIVATGNGDGRWTDVYVTPYADAQATIAALQARVKELEQWVQDQSTANLEIMRHTDEMQSRAMEAEQQLTQRTAELEAANRKAAEQGRYAVEMFDEVKRVRAELERVRGERDEANELVAALSSKVAEYEVELNGDPQNFYGRGRTVGLRTLIAALPKVEGEIRVGKTMDDCWFIDNQDAGGLRGRYKEDGLKYAALLQHRQGMEG